MVRLIIMRLMQIWDFLKSDGFASFLRHNIYINRKAILIEKNLLEVNNGKRFLEQSTMRFEEITRDKLNHKHYQFAVKNRHFKALNYLKKGYGGHAIVKGDTVIGDIWYSATSKCDQISVHPDVHRFGIESSEDHAYSFDQFVAPTERGNNVAAALLNGQLYSLRKKGYLKACAYYWADNIPAVWNTRVMNKFKELKTLRVNGCWLYKRIASEDN